MVTPFITIGAICQEEAEPQGENEHACQSPGANTSCALVCDNNVDCHNCCDTKAQNHPGSGSVQNCKTICNSHHPVAIIRLRLGSDAYSAVIDGQPASGGDTYSQSASNSYADGGCVAGAAIIAAEDAQPSAANEIFQMLPTFMDTIDTRGVLASMTPCERCAVLNDVTAHQSELSQVDQELFEKYKASFDAWAIARALANGQTDPESIRQEFNKYATEYWYRKVVSQNPNYAAIIE
ncbi:MAG: hypothetical protein HZA51_05820 [Planctomycetes bacterium]|nr:hypothetical protein [Planctomycetota bacterium]